MRAQRGMAWLLGILLVSLLALPNSVGATTGFAWGPQTADRAAIILVGTPSSLEAQMFGEKPAPARPALPSLLPEAAPSLQLHQDGGATVKLPYNLEMNISFLYKREPGAVETPQRFNDTPLFMKYSMDYRVLPNLQVGLNAYLYRPAEDSLGFQRQFGKQMMGFGPQLKYDLGRWSFLLKSQVESGNRDQAEGLQHWFRVWYAF